MGKSRRDPTPGELRARAAVYRGQAESSAAGPGLRRNLLSVAAKMERQADEVDDREAVHPYGCPACGGGRCRLDTKPGSYDDCAPPN